MKDKLAGLAAVTALGLALCAGSAGCGKNTAPVNQMEIALKLPGATNVFAALEKKDYEGAMAAWAKVKESATTEQQQLEFTAFTREFKNKLMEASTTDPKATEALNALRAFTATR